MPKGGSTGSFKPRELRRRMLVQARIRAGSCWADACIMNISSRGLMIHTGQPLKLGTSVEVRRGEHAIEATVVWRDGPRAGLSARERIPLEAFASDIPPPAKRELGKERRRQPRPEDRSRLIGRRVEFLGVVAAGASLAVAAAALTEQAFARPLAAVAAAIGP